MHPSMRNSALQSPYTKRRIVTIDSVTTMLLSWFCSMVVRRACWIWMFPKTNVITVASRWASLGTWYTKGRPHIRIAAPTLKIMFRHNYIVAARLLQLFAIPADSIRVGSSNDTYLHGRLLSRRWVQSRWSDWLYAPALCKYRHYEPEILVSHRIAASESPRMYWSNWPNTGASCPSQGNCRVQKIWDTLARTLPYIKLEFPIL